MAGRTSFYGGIVLDGLVFHIDSAKQESYSKRGLRYMQNGSNNLFVDFVDTYISPSINNATGSIIGGATFSNFTPYHLTPYTTPYIALNNNGIGTFYGNIEFDGVDDYVSFSPTPEMNGTTDITVSSWFYVNKFRSGLMPFGGTFSTIASRYAGGNGWELYYDNSGIVHFGGRENGSQYIYTTASMLLKQSNMYGLTANGGWYNAVGIKKGNEWSISVAETNTYIHVNNIVKTYKGILKHQPGPKMTQSGTGTIPFTANNLVLGKENASNAYYMNGRLMNLSIYNRALSLEEVNQNYESFSKRIIEVLTNCVDVTIGSQIWTSCNLNVSTYRNGDIIPQVTDPTQWTNLTTGAWCYYDNDPANEATYGKLYNWNAVNDSRGLAPDGYHVPSDTEWTTLETFLGGNPGAGGKLKEIGTSHWIAPNTGATDQYGFTALPGGVRPELGDYGGLTMVGYWWTATQRTTSNAWMRGMSFNNSNLYRDDFNKAVGYSVRLIKD